MPSALVNYRIVSSVTLLVLGHMPNAQPMVCQNNDTLHIDGIEFALHIVESDGRIPGEKIRGY